MKRPTRVIFTKKIFNIDNIDVNEILISKKKHMVKRAHLNTNWI